MPRAWRLTKTRYLADAFSGEGARLYGGRWNSPGRRAVYASETLSLAALEVLVHLDASGPLKAYSYIPVEFDPALVESVERDRLPTDWWAWPVPPAVVAIGDRWLIEGRSAVLSVPSAVVPTEHNFILNPQHPHFGRITIGEARPFAFDLRLVRGLREA